MVVEVADAAALPVRERILARVRVTGHADLDDQNPRLLRLRPRSMTLEESGIATFVHLGEFVDVQVDPFGCCEASLLSHLDAAHADFVAALTSLLDPRHLQGVVRVWPIRLDQHGIVLRLEYAQRHRDARLQFGAGPDA